MIDLVCIDSVSKRVLQRHTFPGLCPSYLHVKTIRRSIMFDSLYLKEESIYGNNF